MEGELPAQPQGESQLPLQQEEGEQEAQQPGLVHPGLLTYNEAESRFYCPFPGCTRSFAELWRLKVHYRAPPDIRGSGKERGHGTELMHCPKCGQTLKPGKHHVGCVVGKAPRPSSKRKGSGGGDAAALDEEGLPSPKKSKKKGGSSKAKGPAAAAAEAAARGLQEHQASSSNAHTLASLQAGDWGMLDLPPPDPNSLLMPLPPPALWPELAAPPPPQPPLPPSFSDGQQQQQQQQQQQGFTWTDPAGVPSTVPFPFMLAPPPPPPNGPANHLDPAWAAWTQYQQQQQQQPLTLPFPLNPPALNPADLQLHQFAQQQQQQQQQHAHAHQQLPQHQLHPSLTHAPHVSMHRPQHHAHHSASSGLMPPPARHSAHAQDGIERAGSLASSLPSLGSLPSELPDALTGVHTDAHTDADSHNTGALGTATTAHAHGSAPWAHAGAESMPALGVGMGSAQTVGGVGIGMLAQGGAQLPQPHDSTACSTGDMLQEVDGDLLRVPSPPPLPHDFHPGVPKPMFNFSQFQQRLPPQQMHTGGLPTQGLGDLETSELAELNVVYDCTDDGELMQLLFGIGGDVPSMATVHMHKGPSPPHLPFDEDDSTGLFMKPKSMQNMPSHGGQLLPHRPSTPMPPQPQQHPSHTQQPPLKHESSSPLHDQQQQQQLLQNPHAPPAFTSTALPPPPSTSTTPHGLHTHPQLNHQLQKHQQSPRQPHQQPQQHADFLQHDPQQQQHLQLPWQGPIPHHHHQWMSPLQPPIPHPHLATQHLSTQQQPHAHMTPHPYSSTTLNHTLPMHTTRQHLQQPHKQHHQTQLQQNAGMPCPSAAQLCGQAELVRQHRAPHASPVLTSLGPFANDGDVEPSDNLPMLPPSGGEGCELGA